MLFKLFSRVMMTVAIYFVYRMIEKRGAVPSFGWHNSSGPDLYGGRSWDLVWFLFCGAQILIFCLAMVYGYRKPGICLLFYRVFPDAELLLPRKPDQAF